MRFACTLGFVDGRTLQYFFTADTYRDAEETAAWGVMKEHADTVITIRELPQKSGFQDYYTKRQAQ